MDSKVWFITGASRGFGRIWAEAALERGDKVVATARDAASIADFKDRFGELVLPLALDVTDAEQVKKVVAEAHAHFGRLDVVVNNAGYALVGSIEEAKEADVRAAFDTNYFGPIRVIQAVLPFLRKQGSGHILGVSSTIGLVAFPMIGSYSATKWAIEALHESLAQEVRSFGIQVTLVEPGSYATEFGSAASLKFSEGMDAYTELRQQVVGRLSVAKRGDPQATAGAILKLVDAENPPLRFFLGDQNFPLVRAAYASRFAEWEAWESVSNAAQGDAR